MKGRRRILLILIVQGIVAVYTLASAMGKFAADHDFLSVPFLLLYGAEIALLGLYAILWQQVIRRVELSVAYANRAVALLWSMVWAVAFFGEKLTPGNIAGIAVVLIGTMVVNSDELQ